MDEIERRLDAYVENDLPEADRQALCQWLEQDDAHIKRFIRTCFLHWQLFAIGQRKVLQRDVEDLPRRSGANELKSALSGASGVRVDIRPRSRLRSRAAAFVALAASVAVVAAVGLYFQSPETVAQVTGVSADAAWSEAVAPTAGTFLRQSQWVELQRGRLLATLSSGVQVVVQGPARFQIEAGNELYLHAGRMTVVVPRQASGFVVDSPVGRFVDLGTEYTLAIQTGAMCELHVFSGLVEIQPAEESSADRLRVPEGRAVEFDPATGAVNTLPYREELRMSL